MQENYLAADAVQDNCINRLDPRTKLALLLLSFIMVLLPQRPELVAPAALLVAVQVSLARAWRVVIPMRWLLLTLALFSVAVWAFMARGPTLLFGRVSREALAFGLANFLKLGTMMVAGLTLLATTPVEELFVGLVKLRLPYAAAFAFALALRWVPEIFATVLRVSEAQSARGLTWKGGNLWERFKRQLPLLVPIFLLTLRRSQAMAWALEARGFQKSPRRTYLLELRPGRRDWLALALGLLAAAPFVLLHVKGWDLIPGLKI